MLKLIFALFIGSFCFLSVQCIHVLLSFFVLLEYTRERILFLSLEESKHNKVQSPQRCNGEKYDSPQLCIFWLSPSLHPKIQAGPSASSPRCITPSDRTHASMTLTNNNNKSVCIFVVTYSFTAQSRKQIQCRVGALHWHVDVIGWGIETSDYHIFSMLQGLGQVLPQWKQSLGPLAVGHIWKHTETQSL